MKTSVLFNIPDWVSQFVQNNNHKFSSKEERMEFVLELARRNILLKTGGPFSAAIFNIDTNQLISCGVNRVPILQNSAAHGQMMAIMLAQQSLKTCNFRLLGNYQIVTSSKMCVMCLGGVIWSGLSRVLYGADSSDVLEITGFDQGPIPKQYTHELNVRGIQIQRILNDKGRQVLELYVKTTGLYPSSETNKHISKPIKK